MKRLLFSSILTESVLLRDYTDSISELVHLLSNRLGDFHRYPELEHYHGNNGIGVGVRYFLKGQKSVRFNWSRHASNSHLDSITVWTGNSHVPNYHIHGEYGDPIGDIEFSAIAPTLAEIINHPHAGDFDIGVAENVLLHKGARALKISDVTNSLIESIVDRLSSRYFSFRQFKAVANTTIETKIFEAIITTYKNYFMVEQSTTGELRYRLINCTIDKDKLTEELEHNANTKQPHLRVSLAGGESIDTDNQTQVERDFPDDGVAVIHNRWNSELTSAVKRIVRNEQRLLVVIPDNPIVNRREIERLLVEENVNLDAGYVRIFGMPTTEQLYNTIYENSDRTILLYNTLPKRWDPDISIMITNISLPELSRIIEYPDSKKYPTSVEFTGNMIIIPAGDVSSSDINHIFHTNKQVLSLAPENSPKEHYITSIIDDINIAGELSHVERVKVLDLLLEQTTTIKLRTLVRAMQIAGLEIPNVEDYIRIYYKTT